MVSPRPKKYVVLIRPDVTLRNELERLTTGLDASKLIDPPQQEVGVDDALRFLTMWLWHNLGGDSGEFELDHRGDEMVQSGAGQPGVVEVQYRLSDTPAPAEVIDHVVRTFADTREALVTMLTQYRQAMDTTGKWPA